MTERATDAGSGLRSRAFVALLLVYLAVAVNGTVSNIALPRIAQGLGADTEQLAWIVNATPMTGAAVLLFAGGAADRFGRRRLLYIGIGCFLVSALLSLVVQSPAQLIGLRAVSGMASALTMPAAMALVFTVVAARARSTAIGLMSSTQAMGSILGPLLGGLVLLSFAWPAAYLVVVPFLLLALLMLVSSLPRHVTAVEVDRPPLDLPGATLTAVAGVALIAAVLAYSGDDDLIALASAAVGAAAIAGLWWWERRTPHGLLDLEVMAQRRWYIPTIGVFMVNFVLGGVMFVSTQYTQLVLGFSPLAAGAFLLPALLVWTASAALSGMAVRRFGHRLVITAGFVAGAVGLLIVVLAAVGPSTVLLCLGLGLIGLIGAAPAQLTHLTVSAFPQERRGAGAALNSLTLRFGLAFGVALVAAGLSLVYVGQLTPWVSGLAPGDSEQALSGLAGALAESVEQGGLVAVTLAQAARDSFVSGFQVVLAASAFLVLVTAALIAVGLPRGIDIVPDTVSDTAL